MRTSRALNASEAWLRALGNIITFGHAVAPRGKATKEILHNTVAVDMNFPVVGVAARALSYKFMAAEALWILSGDDTVEGIAPYNKHIEAFSDNGVTFFGAYGPHIIGQREYVVGKLLEDRETRQAVLTIWRQNPPATKDYPCTIAMSFDIRDDKLNCHVFMRSSDVWLGLPYDIFNFCMIATSIVCFYNNAAAINNQNKIQLGALFMSLASSHLYAINEGQATVCYNAVGKPGAQVPQRWLDSGIWLQFVNAMIKCRDGEHVHARPGDYLDELGVFDIRGAL